MILSLKEKKKKKKGSRTLSSVVRLRVHFDFGHFSNWAFYSEHCKHMRLISDDLS